MLQAKSSQTISSCVSAVLVRLASSCRRILSWAEADRAVVFGVLNAFRGMVTGPVTALVIGAYFTPELQGYYFTFSSLLALQVFLELGLGQVIIQFASHEWASLNIDQDGHIVGSQDAQSRLVSLGRMAFGWYGVAGCLLTVGLSFTGYMFFAQSKQPPFDWIFPWLVLCVVTGLRFCIVPFWSLLEGANQVSRVYAYRLVEGVLTALIVWIAIVLDAGLWVPTLSTLVGLSLSAMFLIFRYRRFFSVFMSPSVGPRIQWRRELWPLQWKIALSWLSGYFSFSLFTPVMFHYHGAVVAGQMGMTWALAGAVSAVSSTWVYSKIPRLGIMVAKREFGVLDRLIVRLTVAAVSVACVMSLGIWIGLVLLNSWGHPLASRVLSPLPAGLFLLATVLMQVSIPQSAYLRAHKKEPFLGLSLASGVLIAFATWFLASQLNVTAVAAGYLCVVSVMVLVGTVIWNRCKSDWHNQDSRIAEPVV